MAGGKVLLAVEWDDNAVETYRLNFPDTPIYHGDIAKLSVEECLERIGLQPGELDVLDGSPPCQGFSTAGKREMSDSRNQLFREYVRLLRGLQPKVFVMENVSGMVKGKMKLIFAEAMRELKASGYTVKCRLMNAMYYSVPQMRKRVIFIGVRNDLKAEVAHPQPQTRPSTLREAWTKPIDHQQMQTCSDLQIKRWAETTKGKAHHARFSLLRLNLDKTPNTILRTPGSGGHMHPDEPRLCSVGELKRIASFPDDFVFVGNWYHACERIGNSVPPLFMKAIAEHIRNNILSKATLA